MRLQFARRESPIGQIVIAWDGQGVLRVLDFGDYDARMRKLLQLQYGACECAEAQAPTAISGAMDKYFVGDIRAVDKIAVMTGGTEFQKSVWAALRRIPAGTTLSYGALAQQLGCPKAVRAVGGANGANPISIVVPCHRVIGADGSLTGFGGGIERKRWLLAHEKKHAGSIDLFSAATRNAVARI